VAAQAKKGAIINIVAFLGRSGREKNGFNYRYGFAQLLAVAAAARKALKH
jgi:hypothetical protein